MSHVPPALVARAHCRSRADDARGEGALALRSSELRSFVTLASAPGSARLRRRGSRRAGSSARSTGPPRAASPTSRRRPTIVGRELLDEREQVGAARHAAVGPHRRARPARSPGCSGDRPALVDGSDHVRVGTKTSSKKTSLKWEWPVSWRRGRTSTPSAFRSITIIADAGVLGGVGVGAHRREPVGAEMGAPLVHTFWPGDPPAAVDLHAARLHRGGVGARAGLAEELTELDLALEARADEALHLLGLPCWAIVRVFQPLMLRSGRRTPSNSSSITSCSIGTASRPQGFGQWGTR